MPLRCTRQRGRQSWRRIFFCRVLTWHSAKALPSAQYVALGKETFADGFFVDCSLPNAALGKAFAECNRGFAECPKHSTKSPSAVVRGAMVHDILWCLLTFDTLARMWLISKLLQKLVFFFENKNNCEWFRLCLGLLNFSLKLGFKQFRRLC